MASDHSRAPPIGARAVVLHRNHTRTRSHPQPATFIGAQRSGSPLLSPFQCRSQLGLDCGLIDCQCTARPNAKSPKMSRPVEAHTFNVRAAIMTVYASHLGIARYCRQDSVQRHVYITGTFRQPFPIHHCCSSAGSPRLLAIAKGRDHTSFISSSLLSFAVRLLGFSGTSQGL